MTDPSKMTKAQLVEYAAEMLDSARKHNKARQEAEGAQAAAEIALARAITERKPVAEADALAACMRAIDAMHSATESTRARNDYATVMASPSSYGDRSHRVGETAAERVLLHLAQRYNVDLVERELIPCQRKHMDSIDQYAVMNALQMACQS